MGNVLSFTLDTQYVHDFRLQFSNLRGFQLFGRLAKFSRIIFAERNPCRLIIELRVFYERKFLGFLYFGDFHVFGARDRVEKIVDRFSLRVSPVCVIIFCAY